MSTCRFCNDWKDQDMVKYGVRHYAHFRCFLENRKSLHDLPAWKLGLFPYRLLREFNITDENHAFVDPVLRAKFEAEGCAQRAVETFMEECEQ